MTHWVRVAEDSRDRVGFTQWYLCVNDAPPGRIVGEVVQINEELGTYYAELTNGRGLRCLATDAATSRIVTALLGLKA